MAAISAQQQGGQNSVPLLVLVSGAPGSGKTTFARQLAQHLRLPHIERDLLMRGLQYTKDETFDREKAGIPVFYDTLCGLLQCGVSLVTDATLYRGKSEQDITKHLLPVAHVVNIHCRAENERKRFYARELEAANGKEPAWLGPHMRHLQAIYPDVVDPLELGYERMEVDTTAGYNLSVETITAQIRSKQP